MSEAAFDELIHAPLRLQICAMLSPVRSLPFSDIRDSLEISDSVLSKHLSALAGAGYVEVSRVRADSRSRRQVTLTKPGRTALRGHLAALQAIAAAAEPAIAEEPSGARAPERRQARREVALDSRSFARQGCCAQQGGLSANRIGGPRTHRDRPTQKSAWLRRKRCFDRSRALLPTLPLLRRREVDAAQSLSSPSTKIRRSQAANPA